MLNIQYFYSRIFIVNLYALCNLKQKNKFKKLNCITSTGYSPLVSSSIPGLFYKNTTLQIQYTYLAYMP